MVASCGYVYICMVVNVRGGSVRRDGLYDVWDGEARVRGVVVGAAAARSAARTPDHQNTPCHGSGRNIKQIVIYRS